LQSLKAKAVNSVKWTTFQTVFNSIILFLFQIIRARFLSPKEFSYLAIILIAIGLFKTLENFGISQAIIQRDDVSEEEKSSLFLFNVLLSFLLAAILFLLSKYISHFFSLPNLENYLKLSSIIIIFNSPSFLFRALLEKSLFFKEISIINILYQLSLVVFSTFFLIIGLGVLGIIYGYIMATILVTSSVIFYCKKHKIGFSKLQFQLKKLYPFLKFGIFVSSKSVINFISIHIDEIIVGYFLLPETLGYYHFGKNILLKLRSLISASFNKVLFPFFSKIKNNNERLCLTYQKISKYTAFVSVPIFLGISVTAHLFIPLIFGEKWVNSIIVVQVISVATVFAMLHANISSAMLYTLNKPNVVFYLEIIITSIYFILLLLFSTKGLNAVLVVFSLKILMMFIAFQYLVNKYLNYSITKYLWQLKNIFLSGIIMVMAISFLQIFLFKNHISNQILTLVLSFLCGALVYLIFSILWEKETIHEIKSLVLSK